MPGTRREDEVWNRALGPAAPDVELGPGDVALRDVLAFHRPAMDGGALHAWDVVGDQGLVAALAGYRYLGLTAAAEALVWLAAAASEADPGDRAAAERLERDAGSRYSAAVPDDDTVVEAFERTYRQRPDDFAPVT